MSSLVEKVKGARRNNWKHKQADSIGGSSEGRRSGDDYARNSNEAPARKNLQEAGRSQGPRPSNDVGGTTLQFSAMGLDDDQTTAYSKTLPPPANDARQHQSTNPISGQIPLPRTPTHHRNISDPVSGFDDVSTPPVVAPGVVPDRDSSLRLQRKKSPVKVGENAPSTGGNEILYSNSSRSTPGHRKGRSVDIAPGDPSPLMPHFTTRSTASPTSSSQPHFTTRSPASPVSPISSNHRNGDPTRQDLRLPSKFDLGNSEHTHVDTRFAPAVTHETIRRQRTEIITPAVHRDSHIHHYYTHMQPISVTEVLPAKHYRLGINGEKIEIPAPEGFQLPEHMMPRKAEDVSHLKQTTRHYVVDEDNPKGKEEPPSSSQYKHDTPQMISAPRSQYSENEPH